MVGKRELKVTIIGDASSAQRAFKNTDKAATGLRGKVKSLTPSLASMAGPLAAAGGAALAFGISSVKAFGEAEAAQKKLDAAFRKFPQLAGANADALRKLNEQLMTKTVYDDDATASAQATLAMFGLTEKQLRTLTPLLQDYASKTGKDLNAAATVLGKAMEGQGRALRAVGIDFVDTGTKAGNFDQIVKGLREQVGGFATREGQTLDGKMQILNNRFGELQEQIGAKLLPVLIKVSDWAVESGIPAFENLMKEIKSIIDGVVWIDRKLRQLGDKIKPGKGKGDDGPGLWDVLKEAIPGTFDSGGIMPGPRGKHSLAWVAGGEMILPTHKQPVGAALAKVGGGGMGMNVTYNISAADLPSRDALEIANRDLGWRIGLAGGV